MYKIIFYKDKKNIEVVKEYIDDLTKKAKTSKNERIKLKKIYEYMNLLKEYGTKIGRPAVGYIDDGLWELRPTDDRIMFFYWVEDIFVFLSYFKKTTQKTPKEEIEKAKNLMIDFLKRSK